MMVEGIMLDIANASTPSFVMPDASGLVPLSLPEAVLARFESFPPQACQESKAMEPSADAICRFEAAMGETRQHNHIAAGIKTLVEQVSVSENEDAVIANTVVVPAGVPAGKPVIEPVERQVGVLVEKQVILPDAVAPGPRESAVVVETRRPVAAAVPVADVETMPVHDSVPVRAAAPEQNAVPVREATVVKETVSVENAGAAQVIVSVEKPVAVPAERPIVVTDAVAPGPRESTVVVEMRRPVAAAVPVADVETIPVHDAVPVRAAAPEQNAVPAQNVVPVQNAVPVREATVVKEAVSVENAGAAQVIVSVEKPVAVPAEKPIIVPAEKPVVGPTEKPVISPAESPVVAPVEKPASASVEIKEAGSAGIVTAHLPHETVESRQAKPRESAVVVGTGPVVAEEPVADDKTIPVHDIVQPPQAAPVYVTADTMGVSQAGSSERDISAVSAATARTEAVVEAVNDLVEAIVSQISVTPSLVRGEGEVHITLKSNVLDGSDITLSSKDGTLTVAVAPATPAAAQAVAGATSRLEVALAEHAPAFRHVAVKLVARKGNADEAS